MAICAAAGTEVDVTSSRKHFGQPRTNGFITARETKVSPLNCILTPLRGSNDQDRASSTWSGFKPRSLLSLSICWRLQPMIFLRDSPSSEQNISDERPRSPAARETSDMNPSRDFGLGADGIELSRMSSAINGGTADDTRVSYAPSPANSSDLTSALNCRL